MAQHIGNAYCPSCSRQNKVTCRLHGNGWRTIPGQRCSQCSASLDAALPAQGSVQRVDDDKSDTAPAAKDDTHSAPLRQHDLASQVAAVGTVAAPEPPAPVHPPAPLPTAVELCACGKRLRHMGRCKGKTYPNDNPGRGKRKNQPQTTAVDAGKDGTLMAAIRNLEQRRDFARGQIQELERTCTLYTAQLKAQCTTENRLRAILEGLYALMEMNMGEDHDIAESVIAD